MKTLKKILVLLMASGLILGYSAHADDSGSGSTTQSGSTIQEDESINEDESSNEEEDESVDNESEDVDSEDADEVDDENVDNEDESSNEEEDESVDNESEDVDSEDADESFESEEEDVNEINSQIKENREAIRASWANFRENYGQLKSFINKPETKEEARVMQKEIVKILSDYHNDIKELVKEGRETIKDNEFDPVIYNESLSGIYTSFVEDMTQFINPDLQDEFEEYVESRLEQIVAREDLRRANFRLREVRKRVLSDKFKQKVDRVLENRPERVLERLDAQIEKALGRYNLDEELKLKLEELKEIVQLKIDELNN